MVAAIRDWAQRPPDGAHDSDDRLEEAARDRILALANLQGLARNFQEFEDAVVAWANARCVRDAHVRRLQDRHRL